MHSNHCSNRFSHPTFTITVSQYLSKHINWVFHAFDLFSLLFNFDFQGCWLTLDGCSNSPDCAMTTKPNSALNRLSAEKMPNADVKFCCCRGDKCNVNVTTDVAGGVEEKRLTDDRDVNGLVPGSYNDYYGSGGGNHNRNDLDPYWVSIPLFSSEFSFSTWS